LRGNGSAARSELERHVAEVSCPAGKDPEDAGFITAPLRAPPARTDKKSLRGDKEHSTIRSEIDFWCKKGDIGERDEGMEFYPPISLSP
jgi:hypothetical protein